MKSSGTWSNAGGDHTFTTRADLLPMVETQSILKTDPLGQVINTAISNDGSYFITGQAYETVNGKVNAGAAYIYKLINNVYQLYIRLQHPDPKQDSLFGSIVQIATDGSRVAIGSLQRNDNGAAEGKGQVDIYRRTNESPVTYTREHRFFHPTNTIEGFGSTISVDDTFTRIVFSAYVWPYNHVYLRTGNSWGHEQTIDESGGSTARSLAKISGDGTRICSINNITDLSYPYYARVWQRSGTTWTRYAYVAGSVVAELRNDGVVTGDPANNTVAINHNGTVVAFSNYRTYSDNGCCIVFRLTGTTMNKQLILNNNGGGTGNSSASSIHLNPSGDTLYISNTATADGLGIVPNGYISIYKWNGSTYVLNRRIIAPTGRITLGRDTCISKDDRTMIMTTSPEPRGATTDIKLNIFR